MARTKKLQPVRHAKVRLLRGVTTRGGTHFHPGVIMRVEYTDGRYELCVYVRGRYHGLILMKQDYPRLFEVVSVPKPEGDTCR